MRVTTDLWVSAIIRRVFSSGGFAAVVRRGSPEAGAVMLVLRDRFGEAKLYAPAPQSTYDEGRPEDRSFTEVTAAAGDEDIAMRIEREQRFDSDLWVVELEMDATEFAKLVSVTTP